MRTEPKNESETGAAPPGLPFLLGIYNPAYLQSFRDLAASIEEAHRLKLLLYTNQQYPRTFAGVPLYRYPDQVSAPILLENFLGPLDLIKTAMRGSVREDGLFLREVCIALWSEFTEYDFLGETQGYFAVRLRCREPIRVFDRLHGRAAQPLPDKVRWWAKVTRQESQTPSSFAGTLMKAEALHLIFDCHEATAQQVLRHLSRYLDSA